MVFLVFTCYAPSSFSSISPYYFLLLLYLSIFLLLLLLLLLTYLSLETPGKTLEITVNTDEETLYPSESQDHWWRHRQGLPAPRWLTYVTYFISKLTPRKNEARLECLIYSDLTITLTNIHNIKTSPAWAVVKKY